MADLLSVIYGIESFSQSWGVNTTQSNMTHTTTVAVKFLLPFISSAKTFGSGRSSSTSKFSCPFSSCVVPIESNDMHIA